MHSKERRHYLFDATHNGRGLICWLAARAQSCSGVKEIPLWCCTQTENLWSSVVDPIASLVRQWGMRFQKKRCIIIHLLGILFFRFGSGIMDSTSKLIPGTEAMVALSFCCKIKRQVTCPEQVQVFWFAYNGTPPRVYETRSTILELVLLQSNTPHGMTLNGPSTADWLHEYVWAYLYWSHKFRLVRSKFTCLRTDYSTVQEFSIHAVSVPNYSTVRQNYHHYLDK